MRPTMSSAETGTASADALARVLRALPVLLFWWWINSPFRLVLTPILDYVLGTGEEENLAAGRLSELRMPELLRAPLVSLPAAQSARGILKTRLIAERQSADCDCLRGPAFWVIEGRGGRPTRNDEYICRLARVRSGARRHRANPFGSFADGRRAGRLLWGSRTRSAARSSRLPGDGIRGLSATLADWKQKTEWTSARL